MSWAGAGPATIRIAGPIDSLSLSAFGGSVAIHAAVEDGCSQSGVLWSPPARKPVPLKDACSNDASYETLTLAGSTAIWWDYDAGNHVYCSDVYVTSLTHVAPHGLGVCDGTEGDTYYEFAGDRSIVAAADYSVCEADCTGANGKLLPDGDYGVEVRRLVGHKLVPLLKPVNFRTFLDAANWRVAVDEPNDVLAVYDSAGKKLWSRPGVNADAGWIVGNTVVVQHERTVRDYSSRSAGPARTLPKGGRVTDVLGGIAVYTAGSALHLLRLSDGRDRVLVTVKGLSDAQITPAGVFYGVVPKTYDGVVTFVPLAQALRRLA
ncbi:MAG TPA: hypothetical protein VLJ76_11270 [Gaiellaceae bacterium]|nr:hypothetical protein [Gaiellaceae bacterium]